MNQPTPMSESVATQRMAPASGDLLFITSTVGNPSQDAVTRSKIKKHVMRNIGASRRGVRRPSRPRAVRYDSSNSAVSPETPASESVSPQTFSSPPEIIDEVIEEVPFNSDNHADDTTSLVVRSSVDYTMPPPQIRLESDHLYQMSQSSTSSMIGSQCLPFS